MTNIFVTADTHFGHANICKFLRDDGSKLRPWDDVADMDEALIANWNAKVNHSDKVYMLGDIVINRKALHTLYRLNGSKVLVKGNHDIFKLEDYLPFFYDIRAYHVLNNIIMSHIPVHEESLGRFKGNVHGHLHARRVLGRDKKPHPQYLCVSVEHTDYAPLAWEEVSFPVR